MSGKVTLFVGSYAPPELESIHMLRFEPNKGTFERVGGIGGIENPTFLVLHPTQPILYAVSESADGVVVSYIFNKETGEFREQSKQSTSGIDPCHLSLDKSGKWLLSVNYTSGSVCLHPIGDHGEIGPMADFIQRAGRSVRDDRQEGPHCHMINNIPNTDYWLVPDLGTDSIVIYRHDAANRKLIHHGEVRAAPGAGPRHLDFHPSLPIFYGINELDSTITVYSLNSETGTFSPLQNVSTLPPHFADESTCADIHVSADGRYVYGSNRGHDSLAVFRVREDGRLETIGHVSTQGRTPRNFSLIPDTDYVLAANQDTDSITVMRVVEGLPVATGERCQISKPVCLKPLSS